MALVGEGKGFKVIILTAVMTVLMTLPVFFLELTSPGLTLAQRSDGQLPPVELRLDRRKQLVRLSTILSASIPDGFPLVAHLKIATDQDLVVAEGIDREVRLGSHPGVIHVEIPLERTSTGWKQAQVRLLLYREQHLLLEVSGRLVEGQSAITDVTQRKPEPE